MKKGKNPAKVTAELRGLKNQLLRLEEAVTQRKLAAQRLQMLTSAVEQSTEGIALADLEGELLFVNRAFAEMHGWDAGELVGENLSVFHTPEQMKRVEAANAQIRSTGTFCGEVWHVRKDGTTFPSEMRNSLIKDDNGVPFGLLGTMRDISEQRAAQEELRRHREHLEELVEARTAELKLVLSSMPNLLFVIGPDDRYLATYAKPDNPILLAPPETFVGQPYWQVLPAPVAKQTRAALDKARSTGELQTIEYSIELHGVMQWFEGTISPLEGTDNVLASAINITERKRAELALKENESQLSGMFEAMAEAVMVLATSGEIVRANPAAERILGMTRDAIRSNRYRDQGWKVLRPDGSPMPLEERPIAVAMATREAVRDCLVGLDRTDGSRVWLNLSAVPLLGGSGEFAGVLVSAADVSRLHQAETELALQAEELARSNAELEQFAYVASHDLQEPLRMVSSFLQLLKQNYGGKLGEDGEDFINYAVDGALRMQQMISDLLEFSRVGRQGDPLSETELDAVMEEALTNLGGAVEDAGAKVTQDQLPIVVGDACQLVQLFQNLLGNAVKFRGERPSRVHVGAEGGEGEWVFRVQDNGIGIPPADAERIFRTFERLHTRDEFPGTGIGLAVCKKIVERHGGRIWAESKPEEGTTIYFTLPSERTEE